MHFAVREGRNVIFDGSAGTACFPMTYLKAARTSVLATLRVLRTSCAVFTFRGRAPLWLNTRCEPHYALAVRKNGQRTYYGDVRLIYGEDQTHYNVEIISFGFADEGNVGNHSPGARALFSSEDTQLIRSAIPSWSIWRRGWP
jgi:hypothetical protein